VQPVEFENELTLLTYQQDGDEDEFHEAYEAAVESVETDLGASPALRIDGDRVETEDRFEVTSPGDFDLDIGEFSAGGEAEVDTAVSAAADAFPDWESRDVESRTDIFREAADRMRNHKFELAATLSLENGKNRTEAMADVDEAIDFLRFYSLELERSDGRQREVRSSVPCPVSRIVVEKSL
jgi:1-pyrroline-5-carboxylate dehydrogenase